MVGWTAGQVRTRELGVCSDPLPKSPAHGLVFTLQIDSDGRRKEEIPDSVGRWLETAAWIIGLTSEEIEHARRRTATP